MKVRTLELDGSFKRFRSLRIEDLPEECRLVVLVGPNGSGKSTIIDALLQWARTTGRWARDRDDNYYRRPGGPVPTVKVDLHPGAPSPPGKYVHVRSAYRYTPSIKSQGISKQEPLQDRPVVHRMIDQDATGARHYQTLMGRFVKLLSDLSQEAKLEDVRNSLAPLDEAMQGLFPGLSLGGLGDPLEQGSFFFLKDGQDGEFHYDVLSSGEKAAFDLLLDLTVVESSFKNGLIGLDEPEAHLNPRVQGALVDELFKLVDASTQVWVATHSVGFLRRSMQLHRESPDKIAFVDLTDIRPDASVVLKPAIVSSDFWRNALATALDDLAQLLAPEVVYLCEGTPGNASSATSSVSWDARILEVAFGNRFPEVSFVSVGGKGDLTAAAENFVAAAASGTRLLRIRDRDDLADEGRSRLLAEDPSLRIWSRRSLESYLLDEQILTAVAHTFGGDDEHARQLIEARDVAIEGAKRSDDVKRALGAVFEAAKRILPINGQLGENRYQFSVDVLAQHLDGSEVEKQMMADLGLSVPPGE